MQFINILTGEPIEPQPWQMELRPGDLYVIENPVVGLQGGGVTTLYNVTFFGVIIDDQDCDPGFFNVLTYSRYCPKGEEGVVCIVEPTRTIPPEEFDAARKKGWL